MICQRVEQRVVRGFGEIAVYAPVMPVPPDDIAFALDKFNRLLDESHNDHRLVYSVTPISFVLTPLKNPHTIGNIGSVADVTVVNRPVEIQTASIVMTDVTPHVFKILAVEKWNCGYETVPVRA